MGCNQSSAASPAANPTHADPRRDRQADKRKASQGNLRPQDQDKQEALKENFEKEAGAWPVRQPWYKKGKYMQGINIILADPPQLRDTYFTVVARNESQYSVDIGFGKESKFDPAARRLFIACSTVSTNHARLHFDHSNGISTVVIEDLNSLNGTFVLGRPPANSTRRPHLEKEVRGAKQTLQGVEYIRLGAACVLVLEPTHIFFDDEPDDSSSDEEAKKEPTDRVEEMLATGWYFPMPCKAKISELTSTNRVATESGGNNGQAARV